MSGYEPTAQDIAKHAFPLLTLDPLASLIDFEPLRDLVGDTRVIGIGEATHGTREFFLLRHRLITFLVTELGFTAVALEAGWGPALALDAWIQGEDPDPEPPLDRLEYWMWDVEEMRGIAHWLRRHNASALPDRAVKVVGIDVSGAGDATNALVAVLECVDSSLASDLAPNFDVLRELKPWGGSDDPDLESRVVTGLATLHEAIEVCADEIANGAGTAALRTARQAVEALTQIHTRYRLQHEADMVAHFNARDAAMASNVLTSLDDHDRLIVLAHNGHVATDARALWDPGAVPMGVVLREHLGDAYRSIGLAFGAGSFQAVVDVAIGAMRLDSVDIGLPPDHTLDSRLLDACSGSGLLVAFDQLPGDLNAWFHEAHVCREVGADHSDGDDHCLTTWPAARFDMLAFVANASRSTPTPTGHRPRW